MTRYYRFLLNQSSIDPVFGSIQTQFLSFYEECLDAIKIQFYKTIGSHDREDYIKTLFSENFTKQFLQSNYIDQNLFYTDFLEELNKYFKDFLSIDLASKESSSEGLTPMERFTKYYYASYISIVLKQALIYDAFYLIFSNFSAENMKAVEKALNRTIEPEVSKKINKKYNIDKNNYVLSLSKIIRNKEELIQVVKETNLFESNLSKLFYMPSPFDKEPKSSDLLFDTFFHNASKYDIIGLFTNLFKEDLNYENFVLKLEVRALSGNKD